MKNKTLQSVLENDHPIGSAQYMLKNLLMSFPEEKREQSVQMLAELFQPFDDMISVLRAAETDKELAREISKPMREAENV